MKNISTQNLALLCLLAGILFAGEVIAADVDKEKTALLAVESWLSLIDEGNYAEGWNQAAQILRDEQGQKQWTRQIRQRRKNLGAVLDRTVTIKGIWSQNPDFPGGDLSFIRFKTSFLAEQTATESITAALEHDGQWRVANYLIATPWPGRRRVLKALLLLMVIVWVWYREFRARYT